MQDEIRGSLAQEEAKVQQIEWITKELKGVRELWEKNLVPFVRVSYARTESDYDIAPTTVDQDASVAVELNREHSLVATWSRPGRTPLDLVRVTSTARSFRVAYVYARGR